MGVDRSPIYLALINNETIVCSSSRVGDRRAINLLPLMARAGVIQHLTGCRFLLSLWIVCNHFVPKEPETALNHVVSRSNVAVSTFVCMSGFITHWAYGERELSSKWKVLHFFVKRIGRVAFTTWTAMVAAIVVMAITGNTSGDVYDVGHVCRCFTFVETWLHPRIWCPNGQTWTVAALIPSWLMYPWSRRIIAAVQRRAAGPGLLMLAVGVRCSAVSPSGLGPSAGG